MMEHSSTKLTPKKFFQRWRNKLELHVHTVKEIITYTVPTYRTKYFIWRYNISTQVKIDKGKKHSSYGKIEFKYVNLCIFRNSVDIQII